MSAVNSQSSHKKSFGRRKDIHRIIFAKGDKVTSITLHPLIVMGGLFVTITFAIAYLGATAYLVFRDDLLKTSHIRQVRIQNAYEDQLSSLRIEIDRITSRQMLDQQSVENKLDRLLGLRVSLNNRQRVFDNLTKTASAIGVSLPQKVPEPRPRPDRIKQARALKAAPLSNHTLAAASFFNVTESNKNTRKAQPHTLSVGDTSVDLDKIEERLQNEEVNQVHQLRRIARETEDRSRSFAAVIRSLGSSAPSDPPHSVYAIGGPFEAASINSVTFDASVLALEENLAHLNTLKRHVRRFPILRPLKTGRITSRFGRRIDPFLGRYAIHSGIDFKAKTGTSVFATGAGKVVKAGWSGGYGQLVEIEHEGGVRTRYAHLSHISVKKGSHVESGAIVGKVGTTGRSTGPHLHYETRFNKKAINPDRFIKAGSQLRGLL